MANATPLFKKGGRQKTRNYRLVSLTSVIGKLLESAIKDEIVEFLEVHSKTGLCQHGFVKERSYLRNLLEFFEEIMSKLHKVEPVDEICLDFQKTFDKVQHRRLLNKIRTHGVRGKELAWTEDWLTGGRQRVEIKGLFQDSN
eukprot:g40885.t1